MKIEDYIKNHLYNSSKIKKETFEKCWPEIKKAALAVFEVFYKRGGTIFLLGNGGSAATAQHIAGELFSMFSKIPFPAHALTTDTSILTSLSNDMGYEYIFYRQLEALATHKDLVIAFSVSGESENVIKGIQLAKNRGIQTIALTGQKGGRLAKIADIVIRIPSSDTYHIQDAHATIGHLLCRIIEEFFSEKGNLRHGE